MRDRIKRDKSGGLVPAAIAENEKRVKTLLAALEKKLRASSESWLYGLKPTALDAHLVVLIARLTDVGREALIPTKLREYADCVMKKTEWVDMMGGRRTMVPL